MHVRHILRHVLAILRQSSKSTRTLYKLPRQYVSRPTLQNTHKCCCVPICTPEHIEHAVYKIQTLENESYPVIYKYVFEGALKRLRVRWDPAFNSRTLSHTAYLSTRQTFQKTY